MKTPNSLKALNPPFDLIHGVLPIGDESPVLHGTCREVRNGNHVLLGEWVGLVEVVFEKGQHSRSQFLRVLCLLDG